MVTGKFVSKSFAWCEIFVQSDCLSSPYIIGGTLTLRSVAAGFIRCGLFSLRRASGSRAPRARRNDYLPWKNNKSVNRTESLARLFATALQI